MTTFKRITNNHNYGDIINTRVGINFKLHAKSSTGNQWCIYLPNGRQVSEILYIGNIEPNAENILLETMATHNMDEREARNFIAHQSGDGTEFMKLCDYIFFYGGNDCAEVDDEFIYEITHIGDKVENAVKRLLHEACWTYDDYKCIYYGLDTKTFGVSSYRNAAYEEDILIAYTMPAQNIDHNREWRACIFQTLEEEIEGILTNGYTEFEYHPVVIEEVKLLSQNEDLYPVEIFEQSGAAAVVIQYANDEQEKMLIEEQFDHICDEVMKTVGIC